MMGFMARSPFNSPLCEFTWSDIVSGNRRSVFLQQAPLEVRFGLQFEPNFWSSFDSGSYFFFLRVFRNGGVLNVHQFSGDLRAMPGGLAAQQWVRVRFGQAQQITFAFGSVAVKAEIWFFRHGGVSNNASQWAMTPHDHGLFVEIFDDTEFFTSPSMAFIGGPGTPPGTPTS
jgi:hypothetical protein